MAVGLGARRGRSRGPELLHLFERWPRIFGYDGRAGTARRRVGTACVGTAASRKSHRRQALLNTDFESPAFQRVGRISDNPPSRIGGLRLRLIRASRALSIITASAVTNRRSTTPAGYAAALARAATEPSARACARPEPAASLAPEAVTPWTRSARKPSRARVLSPRGSP